MNFILFVDLVYASWRARKFPSLRTNLSYPQLLSGSASDSRLIERFSNFLSEELKYSLKEILQINVARNRVVALVESSNLGLVVVKWVDPSSVSSFNFLTYFESEIECHKYLSPKSNKVIPKYIDHGENYIIVEYASGIPLNLLENKSIGYTVENFERILENLENIYIASKSSVLTPPILNKSYNTTVNNLISSRGQIGLSTFIAVWMAKGNVYELISSKGNEFFNTFKKIPTNNLVACRIVGDLYERNILCNEESNETKIVDFEDSMVSHPIFDLANFVCRFSLINEAIKLDDHLLPCVKNLLQKYDQTNVEYTFSMFKNLLCIHFMISGINPWLWPSASSFEFSNLSYRAKYNLTRRIWNNVSILL